MELILARGDPDAAAVDPEEARLALQLLRPERHAQFICHLFDGHLGCCGHRLRGVHYALEQAALVEHNVVCDAHLGAGTSHLSAVTRAFCVCSPPEREVWPTSPRHHPDTHTCAPRGPEGPAGLSLPTNPF